MTFNVNPLRRSTNISFLHRLGIKCLLPLLTLLMTAPLLGQAGPPPNILLVLVDDLGIEHFEPYLLQSNLPSEIYAPASNLETRTLNWLRFQEAWSNPWCSPTRTSIMTGLYGFSTGIGYLIAPDESDLDLTRPDFLPKLLDNVVVGQTAYDYETAAFGKWHMGEEQFGEEIAPIVAGFDHYEGILEFNQTGNLDEIYENYAKTSAVDLGGGQTSFSVTQVTSGYITRDIVDWIVGVGDPGYLGGWLLNAQEPWFAYVPFPTPHDPLHCPPESVYVQPHETCNGVITPGDVEENRAEYHNMIQILDEQIERLLTKIEASPFADNTIVIFASDNGSTDDVRRAPMQANKVKGTVFEGGVRVPFMIGDLRQSNHLVDPGVVPRTDAMVNLSDLYETILELAGATPPVRETWEEKHSQSLVGYFKEPRDLSGARDCVYTEVFQPNGLGVMYTTYQGAVAGTPNGLSDVYKSVMSASGGLALFNLSQDEFETVNRSGDFNAGAIFSDLETCRLSLNPPCGGVGAICSFDSQCCSNNCVFILGEGQCVDPAAQ